VQNLGQGAEETADSKRIIGQQASRVCDQLNPTMIMVSQASKLVQERQSSMLSQYEATQRQEDPYSVWLACSRPIVQAELAEPRYR
jgi:hypothetical protein